MDKYLVDNRKQAKRWCFTLFTEDDSIPYKWQEHLAYCRWQKEQCGETQRIHLQGWLILKKINRLTWLKKHLNSTAHWEHCKGSNEDNEQYCSKEETRIGEPHVYGTLQNSQGKRSDIIEMREILKNGGSLDECKDQNFEAYARYHTCLEKEFMHLKTLEGKEDVLSEFANVKWKPWQQQIIDLVDSKPDRRSVNWIWSILGDVGKSYLTSYLVAAKSAFLVTGGRQTDILYAYNNERIVVFDIARAYVDNVDYLYTVMENFKNGMFLNSKFVSGMRVFKVPHVIVFANFEPNYKKLSEDRWRVKQVS